jgi:pseudouridine synthase
MRLAKLIAQRGVASRREAEELIRQGLVTVNGETAVVTTPADPDADVVHVRGEPLPAEPEKTYVLLNKPRGYITARRDPGGRKSVLSLVSHLSVRVEPVGRLDYDTEGALLLTNDGELAHRLAHPSSEVPKVYRTRVEGIPGAAALKAIVEGVPLDDGLTAPARVRVIEVTPYGDAWLEITVTEGRNRLIRRMMRQVGHPVHELRRESIAGVQLDGLELGQSRELASSEVERLRIAAKLRTRES